MGDGVKLREKYEAMVDNLKEKVLTAIDEGKVVDWSVDADLASYQHDGFVKHVPTGALTFTVTIPGILDSEAIAIALERDEG